MRRASWTLAAPARAFAARRRAHGARDAIKSWLAGADREDDDLSIRDYVSALERAEVERFSSSDARAKSPAEISFPASRARAYVAGANEGDLLVFRGRIKERRRAT